MSVPADLVSQANDPNVLDTSANLTGGVSGSAGSLDPSNISGSSSSISPNTWATATQGLSDPALSGFPALTPDQITGSAPTLDVTGGGAPDPGLAANLGGTTDTTGATGTTGTGTSSLTSLLSTLFGSPAAGGIAGLGTYGALAGYGISQAQSAQDYATQEANKLTSLGTPFVNEANSLLAQYNAGTLNPSSQAVVDNAMSGGATLISGAAPLSTIANNAFTMYQNGSLPSWQQTQLDQQVAAEKQAVAQRMQSAGITDSSVLQAQYQQIDDQAAITKGQLNAQNFATGNQAYDTWLTSTQAGQQLQQQGLQFAAQAVNQLFTNAIGSQTIGGQPIEQAIQLELQSNTQISQSLMQFMGALASAYAYQAAGGGKATAGTGTAAGTVASAVGTAGSALGTVNQAGNLLNQITGGGSVASNYTAPAVSALTSDQVIGSAPAVDVTGGGAVDPGLIADLGPSAAGGGATALSAADVAASAPMLDVASNAAIDPGLAADLSTSSSVSGFGAGTGALAAPAEAAAPGGASSGLGLGSTDLGAGAGGAAAASLGSGEVAAEGSGLAVGTAETALEGSGEGAAAATSGGAGAGLGAAAEVAGAVAIPIAFFAGELIAGNSGGGPSTPYSTGWWAAIHDAYTKGPASPWYSLYQQAGKQGMLSIRPGINAGGSAFETSTADPWGNGFTLVGVSPSGLSSLQNSAPTRNTYKP